ncbi:hypothetical protein ACNKHR_05495 [Shigella flexneri]
MLTMPGIAGDCVNPCGGGRCERSDDERIKEELSNGRSVQRRLTKVIAARSAPSLMPTLRRLSKSLSCTRSVPVPLRVCDYHRYRYCDLNVHRYRRHPAPSRTCCTAASRVKPSL